MANISTRFTGMPRNWWATPLSRTVRLRRLHASRSPTTARRAWRDSDSAERSAIQLSLVGYYRRSEHDEHDLRGISVPKTAAAGPRPRDGVRGGGTGRPHRAVARQSHLVVPLAQRVAAPAATRPLHRPRPDRHGRLRQSA